MDVIQVKPLIIAELSANHQGSKDHAIELIVAAAAAGAHAVKLQTYTADTMTMDVDTEHFRIEASHSLWGGRNLYRLYEEAHTPWEWHGELFEVAINHGLLGFSTPFDLTAVDFLESLGVPMYKIASIEIQHLPLIKKVAETGKPMIISTGAATIAEIEKAARVARSFGSGDLTLMICTSSYPASASESNLSRMSILRDAFGVKIGFSDHSPGIGAAIAAATLGAEVIEKHLKLNDSSEGVDADFSITPAELALLVSESRRARDAVGESGLWQLQSEMTSWKLRPSIHIATDVKAGDIVSSENLKICRPNGGLAPEHFGGLIGRHFSRALPKGSPAVWLDFS